ncbi:Salicylate hydroxylase, partial [Leucoagaricus sp. SymC.cos]
GAGIGGLALAAFISFCAKDIAVDIYEAKPGISSIGAGIAIWKRTWEILKGIGLEKEVKERGLPLPKDGEVRGPIFRKADQPTKGIDFHNQMMPYGPLTIPRPILLEMLMSYLSEQCNIYTSTHVASYKEQADGTVLLKLDDGSTRTADLLIGCDGVHSATRATLFKNLAEADPSKGYEKFAEPKWSGQWAYRGVVDRNQLREKNPRSLVLDQARIVRFLPTLHWCGKSRHVVTHPFGDIVNLVCYVSEENGFGKPYNDPWVATVQVQEVINCYLGWEPDLAEVVSMIQEPSRWAIHVVGPLPIFVSGHVGLLGDAAHAMTPHQGVGGGQAIEDAYILGRLLAHEKTTKANLAKVLEIYQQIRLSFAQAAAERSWSSGLLYDFIHPDFKVSPDATEDDLKPIGQAVGAAFAWLGKGGCDEDWVRAENLVANL